MIDSDPDSDSNYESCIDTESRDAIASGSRATSLSVQHELSDRQRIIRIMEPTPAKPQDDEDTRVTSPTKERQSVSSNETTYDPRATINAVAGGTHSSLQKSDASHSGLQVPDNVVHIHSGHQNAAINHAREHGTRNQYKSTSRKRKISTPADYRATKSTKKNDWGLGPVEDVSETATELRHEQPRNSDDAKSVYQHIHASSHSNVNREQSSCRVLKHPQIVAAIQALPAGSESANAELTLEHQSIQTALDYLVSQTATIITSMVGLTQGLQNLDRKLSLKIEKNAVMILRIKECIDGEYTSGPTTPTHLGS